MGMLRDLRALRKQTEEINRNFDPAARMREGMATMARMQSTLAEQTELLDLERIGVPAVGTIVELTDTGSRINFAPVVRLGLLVEVADRPPYPVTRNVVLPVNASAQAGVGQRVAVLVDPEVPDRVLVRWGR